MKYFIRSVKYFFYFAILTSLIIAALVATGMADGNIETMFEGGYNALWKMAIFFVLVAAVYPKIGFIRKSVPVQAGREEIRGTVISYLQDHHFELESEDGDIFTFRQRGFLNRLTRMYEDRLTLIIREESIEVEGLRKDAFRIATGLEYRLNPRD